jgi:hypothetical protein
MKAAGSRLCGAAGTAQHYISRPAGVASLSSRPFVTTVNYQVSVKLVSSDVSLACALLFVSKRSPSFQITVVQLSCGPSALYLSAASRCRHTGPLQHMHGLAAAAQH